MTILPDPTGDSGGAVPVTARPRDVVGPTPHVAGPTPYVAGQGDQRFSYMLHFPARLTDPARIAVLIHDSFRAVEQTRALFAKWADAQGVVLFLPLFPLGIGEAWGNGSGVHGYKFLSADGIRYDEIVLAQLEEAGAHYGFRSDTFALFGFSGGAQFAHRFAMLYPEKIRAVAIGAPGVITLVDDKHSWWTGTGDAEEIFGRPVRPDVFSDMAVLVVVGEGDTDAADLEPPGFESNPFFTAAGAHVDAPDRLSRARSLFENIREHGGDRATLAILPGVGHELEPVAAAAVDFFTRAWDDPSMIPSEMSE